MEHGDFFNFETSRLRLVPCTSEWKAIADRVAQDPRVAQSYFVHVLPSQFPTSAAANHCGTLQQHEFVALTLSGGEFVGVIKLIRSNLSFYLEPRFWGQGLGKEMVQAVFARLQDTGAAGQVEALLLRRNMASRRIVESLGFRFFGIKRIRHQNRSTFDEYLHYRYWTHN